MIHSHDLPEILKWMPRVGPVCQGRDITKRPGPAKHFGSSQ